jgi:hypothetical protein
MAQKTRHPSPPPAESVELATSEKLTRGGLVLNRDIHSHVKKQILYYTQTQITQGGCGRECVWRIKFSCRCKSHLLSDPKRKK